MSKKFKVSLKFILPGLISALGAQSELDALDSAGDGGLIMDEHFRKKSSKFSNYYKKKSELKMFIPGSDCWGW